MNSILDLFLIYKCACARVTVTLRLSPATSVSGKCTAERSRDRFCFIEVSLFSFFIVYLLSAYSSNLSSDEDWSRNV